MIALACASHLLVDLPLFGGPVVFVIGAVVMIRRSERRRAAEEPGPGRETGLHAGLPDHHPDGEQVRVLTAR